ncbi:MAG: hypothetical protein WB809_06510 [Thermoplasmata archaeon]
MGLANAFGGRVARGLGAFVLADLITGLAAFSVISLAGLWLFSVTWIHVVALAAARGTAFGTPVQLDLAWVGALAALPLAGGVVYVAIRAYGLPRDLLRTGGSRASHDLRSMWLRF